MWPKGLGLCYKPAAWGNIARQDADRIRRLISDDLPRRVAADPAYDNARRNSDAQNARIEHDKAPGRAMVDVMKDDTELFRRFSDDPDFRRWLTDAMFRATFGQATR